MGHVEDAQDPVVLLERDDCIEPKGKMKLERREDRVEWGL